MNYRIIAYFIGRILRLEAVFMAPALAISLYQGEHAAAAGFLIAMGALLLVGVPWSWKRPENQSLIQILNPTRRTRQTAAQPAREKKSKSAAHSASTPSTWLVYTSRCV